MDASAATIDRSRTLRLLLGGLVASGAAVVVGMILGGAPASAQDEAPLDGLLGTVSSTVTGVDDVVSTTVAQTTQTTQAVAPAAAPLVEPVLPVVEAVVAPVAPVVHALPTSSVGAVVTPIAQQVDGLVATLPVVGSLATAPVETVTTPVVDLVDGTVADVVDVVVPPEVLAPLDPVTDDAGGDAVDGASPSSASLVEPADDAAPTIGVHSARPSVTAPASAADLAARLAPAPIAAAPTSTAVPGAHPGQDTVPQSPAPIDADDKAAPATAGSASAASAVADATHASLLALPALRGPAAQDDRLPTSAVGDHDTSPD